MPHRDGVLERVMGSIERVRKPGEPPQESLHSFDEFECDLCKGFAPRAGISQCPYCGRWVCRSSCWDPKRRACHACASVIDLGLEAMAIEERAARGRKPQAESTSGDAKENAKTTRAGKTIHRLTKRKGKKD
jgi:hypothetical protein